MRLRAWAAILCLILFTQTARTQTTATPTALRLTGESVRLAFDVGGERTWFGLDVRFPPTDAEASESFAAGSIGNLACRRVQVLRVQRFPVCDWLRYASIPETRTQAAAAGADGMQVRFSFAVLNRSFLVSGQRISVDLGSEPLNLQLAARVRTPFSLTGADPLPASMRDGRVVFHPVQELDRPIEIRFAHGFPLLQEPDPTARLLRPLSHDARVRADQIAVALNVIAGGIGLLVPLLATAGLLRRLRGAGRAKRPERQATALTWTLAVLVGLPVAGYLHQTATNLVREFLYPAEPLRYWMDAQSTAWLVGSPGTLSVVVLVVVAAGAFTRLGGRLGVPIRFPSYRFGLALFLSAMLAEGLPLIIALVGAPHAILPLEVHAGLALLVWATLLIWTARLGSRLFLLPSAAQLALGAILILLLLPWRGWPDFMAGGAAAAETTTIFLIGHLRPLAHVAVLIPLLWLLRELGRRSMLTAPPHLGHLAGGAMFTAALMPAAYNWPGLLAAAAALLVVWPRLALSDSACAIAKSRVAGAVLSDLPAWVERLERAASLKSASRGTKLDVKLSEGEIALTEWNERRRALETARDNAVDNVFLPGGLHARDIVLGMSIERNAWRSGLRAAAFGAPIVAILTLFRLIQGEPATPTPAPALAWLATILPPALKMAASTFLLGYFFDRLRGGTGLNKALWLGAAFCAAEILIWLPRLGDASAVAGMLWTFSQHFLMLIPVGVLAFDYGRMRQIEGNGFDWRRFSWFGDPRLLSTGVAASLAALGPTVATLFSGTFASAVRDVVTAVAPTLTGR